MSMSTRNLAILSVVVGIAGLLATLFWSQGDDESQSSASAEASPTAEASSTVVVNISPDDQEAQQQENRQTTAAADPVVDQQDEQVDEEERTEGSSSDSASLSTADRPATTSQSNSAGHPDGERICGPGCLEQYVVKDGRGGRFKRLLLSHDVVRFYGQFSGRVPSEVEHAVLDAFETSCFVWHEQAGRRTYYFFDARPGTDAGVKWQIDASTADVTAAGIANAAFQVNDRELGHFSSAGSVTLSEALNLRCAG